MTIPFPKMLEHPSKIKIEIKRVVIFKGDKKLDCEYYSGYLSGITDESKPFTKIIASSHGYTYEGVFKELDREYYDFQEKGEQDECTGV